MERYNPSAESLEEIKNLAASWGKRVARRALKDAPPDGKMDLQAMEQFAQAALAGLNKGTFEALLDQQSRSLPDHQPCPACGRICLVVPEDRPLIVLGGAVTFHEPVCYCPGCRRDFFPSEGLSASG